MAERELSRIDDGRRPRLLRVRALAAIGFLALGATAALGATGASAAKERENHCDGFAEGIWPADPGGGCIAAGEAQLPTMALEVTLGHW